MSEFLMKTAFGFGLIRGIFKDDTVKPVAIFMSVAAPIDILRALSNIEPSSLTGKHLGTAMIVRPLMLGSFLCLGKIIGGSVGTYQGSSLQSEK